MPGPRSSTEDWKKNFIFISQKVLQWKYRREMSCKSDTHLLKVVVRVPFPVSSAEMKWSHAFDHPLAHIIGVAGLLTAFILMQSLLLWSLDVSLCNNLFSRAIKTLVQSINIVHYSSAPASVWTQAPYRFARPCKNLYLNVSTNTPNVSNKSSRTS